MKTKRIISGFVAVALFVGLCPLGAVSSGKLKKTKIHGYVTNIISPTSFEIEDYKIMKDREFVLEFENVGADVTFKAEDIRVGTEIEVHGMLDEDTGELTAKKILIDLDQFRKLKNTSILAVAPQGIERVGDAWGGIFWADGRRIRIDPVTTMVSFELNKTEKKAQERENKEREKREKEKEKERQKAAQKGEPEAAAADEDEDWEFTNSEPLRDVSQVKAGMYITYEGKEDSEGVVNATRVVFMKNEHNKDEDKLWASLAVKEKPADFLNGKAGELKINRVGKFKLLPSKEVQDYVSALGHRLVPAFQKALPAEDPRKIDFRFYVVIGKDPNAFAVANGIVVISTAMLTMLENEGQLASVLAHEISHVTQEHTWRQLNKDKGKRTAIMIGSVAAAVFGLGGVSDILNLTLAAMVNGYSRRLENQSDRVGLEYMVAAGYDPREAPKVWKTFAQELGDAPTNFFYSSHSNHATRRSFLMVEIRNNYSDLDFSAMKRGSDADYQKVVTATFEGMKKKKKVKVKT